MLWFNGDKEVKDFQAGYLRGKIESLENHFEKFQHKTDDRLDKLHQKLDFMYAETRNELLNVREKLEVSIDANKDKLDSATTILKVIKWIGAAILIMMTLQFGDLVMLLF